MPRRKMSELILEFCQPLIPEMPTSDQLKAASKHAVFVWNLGILPVAEREQSWRDAESLILAEIPAPVAAEMLGILRELLHRRLTTHARDRRAVVGCACKYTGGSPSLEVSFVDHDAIDRDSRR